MNIIHAYLVVNAKHREQFLDKTKQLISETRKEDGNISYRLYEDTEKSNTFIMVERWQDTNAMEIHEKSSHFTNYVEEVKGLLLEPLQADIFEVLVKE